MEIISRLYFSLNNLLGAEKQVTVEDDLKKNQNIFTNDSTQFLDKHNVLTQDMIVLVVGCGSGVELKYIAQKVHSVVSVDIDKEAIERSNKIIENEQNISCQLITSEKLPFDDEKFDLIYMHNVCEHIIDLDACFLEYKRVLKLGGCFVNTFAPLFYSPYGAHLSQALRIPWGHLIFGFRAVLAVRNKVYPGEVSSSSWEDFGLNRITESKYQRLIKKFGFESIHYKVLHSKNISLFSKVPFIKNLFVFGIENILLKK